MVRIGVASKIEKASRQQRTYRNAIALGLGIEDRVGANEYLVNRQATQEPCQDPPGYCEGQGSGQEEGQEIEDGLVAGLTWSKLWFGHGEGLGRPCLCIYM